MSVLSKNPKFMVLGKIDETEVEVEIEKGLMKARYELMGRGEDTDNQESVTDDNDEDEQAVQKERLDATLNYANLRATDIPTVQRLYPPEPASMWKEKAMENVKEKLMDTVKDYKAEHCDSKGNFKRHNLSRQDAEALKELKKDIREKKIVVFSTDKSGKFAVDTPSNYEEAVMKHTERDTEVDEKRVKQIENKVNQHMRQFNKMFNVGATSHHESRVTGATQSTNTPAPPLYGLRKDHKAAEDENIGPPVRPVCGANQAPNSRFSHFLSRIVNDYADAENIQTECRSSEQMKAAFTEYNKENPEVKKKCKVISMDVKALYPSMEWDEIVVAVKEMIENSDKTVENVDWHEIGKYIAVTMSEESIKKEGLEHVIPRRKAGRRKRRVTVAYLCQKENEDKWNSARTPGKKQKKRMLALVVAEGVRVCMESHVYCVGDRVFLQQSGGPIGLELTGAVSRPFMARWDRKYLENVRKAGMKMLLYERYVDDSNQVAVVPPRGWEYDRGEKKVVESQRRNAEKDEDDIPDDQRMAKILLEIANDVMECIKMEADMPSKNDDGKLPILDMKVWTNEDGDIIFQHYEKPMSSRAILHAKSAHPSGCKRSVHVQEIVRRLLNSSPVLDWREEVAPVLSDYMQRMKDAGYGEGYRKRILQQGLAIFDSKIKEEEKGQRPVYRPKSWRKEERRKKKKEKKHEWATEGGFIAPIFVPASPGGELARRMKKVALEEKKGIVNFKIVEMGGRTLKRELQKSNPLATPGCGREECIGCNRERGEGGHCMRNNINYEIECQLCKETTPTVYIGETARNLYTRGGEHLQKKGNEDSFMKKHMNEKHPGAENDFVARVTHSNKDCLTRQVREGVLIRRTKKVLLNSKTEWFQPPLFRIRNEIVNS